MRMLNGRIDTQGTVQDLRASGVLDVIIQVEEEHTTKGTKAADHTDAEIGAEGNDANLEGVTSDKKKARKLVEDEHRETGSVKWRIYKTYFEASYVWCLTHSLFLVANRSIARTGHGAYCLA